MIVSGTNEFTFYGLLRLTGMVAVYSAMGTIIFERIYATIKLETYEQTISNRFFVFCVIYQIGLSILITYSIYRGRYQCRRYMSMVMLIFDTLSIFRMVKFIHLWIRCNCDEHYRLYHSRIS